MEHKTTPAERPGLSLPLQILTQADISRLNREIETVRDFFAQAAIGGTTAKNVPQISQQLTAVINENHLNLLQLEDRSRIEFFLKAVRSKAPIVHVSFASDPKPDFLMKIAAWMRREAHPYVLLHVGLQPSIAAGCVIRTTNKYFDFSFKRHFDESKAKLAPTLKAIT